MQVNSSTVLVIGGYQNGQLSEKTFYLNIIDQSWSAGPVMATPRIIQSCGQIRKDKDSQQMSIIVAGDSSYLSSVEILDEGSNKWRNGPELPFQMYYSQMVQDPNAGVFLVGGFSPSRGVLSTLLQLPHAGADAAWVKLDRKLKIRRYRHTAFLVPDNIAYCS